MKLQNDYQELCSQSGQVESLMQQQIDQKDNIIRQKDVIIDSLSQQFTSMQNTQEQIISLETENDLLESTIRMLQSKLNLQTEIHNEAIEKIAFLENEVDLLKETISQTEEINAGWIEREKKWSTSLTKLQEEIESLISQQTSQINILNTAKIQESLENESKYYNLLEKLEISEVKNQQLSANVEKISRKYKKLLKITNFIKLKQHGLAKAYTTPALKPISL